MQELESDFRGDGVGEVRDDLVELGKVELQDIAGDDLDVFHGIEAIMEDCYKSRVKFDCEDFFRFPCKPFGKVPDAGPDLEYRVLRCQFGGRNNPVEVNDIDQEVLVEDAAFYTVFP